MNNGLHKNDFITAAKTLDAADAAYFADAVGKPLNFAITVHLKKAGVVVRPQQFIGRFVKLAGDWAAYHDADKKRYWIWVMEDPARNGGSSSYGSNPNVHIAIHFPNKYLGKKLKSSPEEMQRRLQSWLTRSGGAYIPKALEYEEARNQFGWIRYILKGADPKFVRQYPIFSCFRNAGPQGTITGDRCRVSESLGKAARDKHGWEPISRYPTNTGWLEFPHLVLHWPCDDSHAD